ncbi:MAG: hypothetical protein M3Q29_11175 [Chloroflexota bacterium]|nr:hypothetical protein [Chloroflexota bacterium]
MCRLWLLLTVLLALLPLGDAAAHGFGETYALPVPLWLYLYGAAAAVVLSFVLVGFFVGEDRAVDGYRRFNLLRLGWFRAVFTGRPFLLAVRLLSVALYALVIVSGLFGEQVPSLNFAPTFVWVIWWVGFGIFVALVGNVWPLVSPWKILFEWADGLARRLGLRGGLQLHEPYPKKLGVWPALALFVAFAWVEIVFGGSSVPLNLAFLALAYSIVTWGGMAYFGKHVWLRQGEAFSVFFDILGKFAPTEVRVTDPQLCRECEASCRTWREVRRKKGRPAEVEPEGDCVNCYECFERADRSQRELNLRPWAAGLIRSETLGADRLSFVVFMLSSVTVDGLFETSVWARVFTLATPVIARTGDAGYRVLQTLGLLLVPAVFLLVYYGFAALVRALGGARERLGEVAAIFVYSLVPIALAYQIAHYYTLLLVQGQGMISLLSDPLGWGWNLFGTVDYQIKPGVVGAAFVWYSQVGLIVAGHVIAVYLAHVIALRLLRNPRRALRSQYPMLVLMVLYTISSLWIISQPIVTQESAVVPERLARNAIVKQELSSARQET